MDNVLLTRFFASQSKVSNVISKITRTELAGMPPILKFQQEPYKLFKSCERIAKELLEGSNIAVQKSLLGDNVVYEFVYTTENGNKCRLYVGRFNESYMIGCGAYQSSGMEINFLTKKATYNRRSGLTSVE